MSNAPDSRQNSGMWILSTKERINIVFLPVPQWHTYGVKNVNVKPNVERFLNTSFSLSLFV